MYSKHGGGGAFKLNLPYELVSVECCGIEQQFSVLVLTLDPGLQALENLFCFLKTKIPSAILSWPDGQIGNQKDRRPLV